MNVLLIGSGGREHALAWKMAQSKNLEKLFVCPGNAGTAQLGINVAVKETDFKAIKELVLKEGIQMLVVGPEAPLVMGIVDFFQNDPELKNVLVIGPDKAGAALEGSKDSAKQFMMEANIPTAAYQSFDAESLTEGYAFLESLNPPYVLKADGLAAGKGVLILDDLEEAKRELNEMLNGKFGTAGNKVVVEEFLKGIELSVFVLTDGENYLLLPSAKDYKRIGEGDTGLNTGGMGAVSPVPFADSMFMSKVEERIVKPTIEGIIRKGFNYKGFIFIGLMNVKGDPFVIEYNVRMGDPETEAVIPRIENDLLDLFLATGKRALNEVELKLNPDFFATLMLVSGGYPEGYEKGKPIVFEHEQSESIVFHAGTKLENGMVLSNEGRVLAITSSAKTIEEAMQKSLKTADSIHFDKKYFRRDIGKDLM